MRRILTQMERQKRRKKDIFGNQTSADYGRAEFVDESAPIVRH